MDAEAPQREMPKYKCHKEVWALKIAGIETDGDLRTTLTVAEEGFAPIEVDDEWMARCKATEDDMGYYVVYEGGYRSWSPSKAFEEGYSRVEDVAGYPV